MTGAHFGLASRFDNQHFLPDSLFALPCILSKLWKSSRSNVNLSVQKHFDAQQVYINHNSLNPGMTVISIMIAGARFKIADDLSGDHQSPFLTWKLLLKHDF